MEESRRLVEAVAGGEYELPILVGLYCRLRLLIERWWSELTTKWLQRSTHRSVAELRHALQQWLATWNDNPRPIVWTKTADLIPETLAAYCQRINDL